MSLGTAAWKAGAKVGTNLPLETRNPSESTRRRSMSDAGSASRSSARPVPETEFNPLPPARRAVSPSFTRAPGGLPGENYAP